MGLWKRLFRGDVVVYVYNLNASLDNLVLASKLKKRVRWECSACFEKPSSRLERTD